jgi:hypothetical protein
MPITYYHIVNPCHHALKISDMLEASGWYAAPGSSWLEVGPAWLEE